MSCVFPRTFKRDLPLAVRGEGIFVFDSTGKKYIDGYSGGASVSCLGHSHPAVIEAVTRQVETLPYLHGAMFTTSPLEELAELVVSDAPSGLSRLFLTSSGSEAVETALMLARQYQVEIGNIDRRYVISRRSSYHGATLTGLAVGYPYARRKAFEPMLMEVAHIAPCYAYRGQRVDETLEEYGRRVADELETAILAYPPNSVLAFVAETVVGTTSGAVPPVRGYFKRIREICDRHGVMLLLDEVFCGMGRTGSLHACEQEGITPDLMTLAKGLGAGYQSIGAVLIHDRISKAIQNGSGAFTGGFTYSGHAVACAAAVAVQKVIRGENLVENVKSMGAALEEALQRRFGSHSHVGDIRGRGLMQTIELVRDRASKETFDPSLQLHERIWQEAMTRGLMCAPGVGTADGLSGNHVVIAPPYLVNKDQIEDIVARLGAAVDAALAATS